MNQKLTMVRGDTASLGMVIDGLDQDLDSAFFTVRDGWEGDIIAQKSLDEGITKQETGVYVVRLSPDDTLDVIPQEYVYDLQIGANSDVFTVMRGVLVIEPDATY